MRVLSSHVRRHNPTWHAMVAVYGRGFTSAALRRCHDDVYSGAGGWQGWPITKFGEGPLLSGLPSWGLQGRIGRGPRVLQGLQCRPKANPNHARLYVVTNSQSKQKLFSWGFSPTSWVDLLWILTIPHSSTPPPSRYVLRKGPRSTAQKGTCFEHLYPVCPNSISRQKGKESVKPKEPEYIEPLRLQSSFSSPPSSTTSSSSSHQQPPPTA